MAACLIKDKTTGHHESEEEFLKPLKEFLPSLTRWKKDGKFLKNSRRRSIQDTLDSFKDI